MSHRLPSFWGIRWEARQQDDIGSLLYVVLYCADEDLKMTVSQIFERAKWSWAPGHNAFVRVDCKFANTIARIISSGGRSSHPPSASGWTRSRTTTYPSIYIRLGLTGTVGLHGPPTSSTRSGPTSCAHVRSNPETGPCITIRSPHVILHARWLTWIRRRRYFGANEQLRNSVHSAPSESELEPERTAKRPRAGAIRDPREPRRSIRVAVRGTAPELSSRGYPLTMSAFLGEDIRRRAHE
ncbi:hypothetical protein LXA43DRAFT_1005458 [Ganoderma leucocontextum]|nr:hypothetical protein LXA43DRAFT_1005458 [Ganoderma leucocontextum]